MRSCSRNEQQGWAKGKPVFTMGLLAWVAPGSPWGVHKGRRLERRVRACLWSRDARQDECCHRSALGVYMYSIMDAAARQKPCSGPGPGFRPRAFQQIQSKARLPHMPPPLSTDAFEDRAGVLHAVKAPCPPLACLGVPLPTACVSHTSAGTAAARQNVSRQPPAAVGGGQGPQQVRAAGAGQRSRLEQTVLAICAGTWL